MSSDEIRRQNLKTIERIENDLAPYFFQILLQMILIKKKLTTILNQT